MKELNGRVARYTERLNNQHKFGIEQYFFTDRLSSVKKYFGMEFEE